MERQTGKEGYADTGRQIGRGYTDIDGETEREGGICRHRQVDR